MNETKMVGRDFRHLAGVLGVMYTSFYAVSPKTAQAVEKLNNVTMNELNYIMTDRGGDEDENGYDIPKGVMHRVEIDATEAVTEEHLRQTGYDQHVSDTLEIFREEMKNGNIKPGTVQHTLANYMIDSLEKIQRREYVPTPLNKESNDYPGLVVGQKMANYSFTPKLEGWPKEVRVRDKNGQEKIEYRFPEDWPKERVEDFFQPRNDQKYIARHSQEELNQSADRINFDGITSAGADYVSAIRQINNMSAIQAPETPEQDNILREHARAAAQRLREEVSAATKASQDDPVALRLFDDKPGQMEDAFSSDPASERALSNDMENINQFISFLDSGLPIASFSEYQELKNTMLNLHMQAKALRDEIEGTQELSEKAQSIRETLIHPPADMNEDQRRNWLSGVKSGLQECIDQFDAIAKEPRMKEEGLSKLADESLRDFSKDYCGEMADRQAGLTKEQKASYIAGLSEKLASSKDSPEKTAYLEARAKAKADKVENWRQEYKNRLLTNKDSVNTYVDRLRSNHVPNFDQMGKSSIENRKKYITGMLDSMSNDMSIISKDLKTVAQASGKLSPALKDAVTKAVRAGDPKLNANPKEYLQALDAVKAEAEKAGNQQILDFAKKNRAYFSNRTLEAQSKGILMDESLKHQRDAIERNGKDNLKQAIDAFNTRRSGIFGGRGTEFGAESPEHKALREAATELGNLKGQLEKAGPDKQKELSEKVKLQAEKVSGLANDYLDKKGRSANTSAGKARLNGAMEILREAEITRIELKRKEAAAARYEEIGKSTEKMLEANKERVQELKEREKRIEQEIQQEKKQRHEQYLKDRKNIKEGMDAAKEAAQAPRIHESPERRRSTSMDQLAEKFGMKEDMKKTGKKEKSHAAQKQAEKGKEQEGIEMGGEE